MISRATWRRCAGNVAAAVGIVVAGLSVGATACAQDGNNGNDAEVARIGDIVVTIEMLEDAWHQNDAASRMQLLQEVYDTRRRALDMVIGEHLIDREARGRGMTREEFLEVELPSRTQPVTDAEIDLIYERNRNAFGDRTLEQMSQEIRAAIEQQRPNQALHEFMRELRDQADDVSVTLDPPRQEVEILADDPSRGPEDAAVVIVEFSDFQCPYCQRVAATLEQVMKRYEGRIRFVYKDYPLPSHAQAFKAAEAGNCAHEQGMFWEFHDRLFGAQDELDVESLKTYARELGLDGDQFAACLASDRYADLVEDDLQVGKQYGVSSTPTVFINGRTVMGAVPLEIFESIIEEELAFSGS